MWLCKKCKLCINAIKNFIYAEFFIIFQMLVRHGGSAWDASAVWRGGSAWDALIVRGISVASDILNVHGASVVLDVSAMLPALVVLVSQPHFLRWPWLVHPFCLTYQPFLIYRSKQCTMHGKSALLNRKCGALFSFVCDNGIDIVICELCPAIETL